MELWPNPANYQSGGAAHTLAFTAAPTATSVQFQYQATTANIQRKTYFLGGAAHTLSNYPRFMLNYPHGRNR